MSMERDDPRQYHLALAEGDVGRYVFLPGDPGRCELIASYFDEPQKVASHREYETWSGYLEGEKVSVTSTGIGGPSAAIAMEELVAIGSDTFVRVGTSGSMQEHIKPGDIAVVSAAIRDEGTSVHYLPLEFPAVADVDLTQALTQAARGMGATVHVGFHNPKTPFTANTHRGECLLQDVWPNAGAHGWAVEQSVLRWKQPRFILSPQSCAFVPVVS